MKEVLFSNSTNSSDINDCESDPRQNYRTCIDKINRFSCICTPSHTDKECSTLWLPVVQASWVLSSLLRFSSLNFLKHKAVNCVFENTIQCQRFFKHLSVRTSNKKLGFQTEKCKLATLSLTKKQDLNRFLKPIYSLCPGQRG